MPAETAVKDWIELPSGFSVSANRIPKNGSYFSFQDAANMDIEAFNKEAAGYGIHIDTTYPIDRLVKYSVFLSRRDIFLSRRDKDGSRMFGSSEYVDMVLDVATAKTKEIEPLASFYKTLTTGPADATRDILKFQEKLTTGRNKGKYIATLLRFDEDGELQPADDINDIIVAGEGWTRILGNRNYPFETSPNECQVENIDKPALLDICIKGYWLVGDEPQKGEERIVLRDPNWDGGRLLSADVLRGRSYSGEGVGALRSRGAPTAR